MAIGNAVQRGSWVYVYNEKNQQIFIQPAGNGPNDGLKGYTSSTVNIQRGSWWIPTTKRDNRQELPRQDDRRLPCHKEPQL